MCNYEIMKSSESLERVEVNLVKNAPYHKKAEFVNDPLLIYVIAKFQRSKWKDL